LVLSRADVDPEKLALSGHAMGEYFAPRAAAYEKRIQAVIANSLCPEFKPLIMTLLGLDPRKPYDVDLNNGDVADRLTKRLITRFKLRFGSGGDPLAGFLDNVSSYSLAGLEGKITCPLLNIAGEAERPEMRAAGHAFYES
jgi:hypothetical protein